jgi:branched-chain amino acid aminotransferase
VDKITIGNGRRGPVVKRLQDEFFAYINGERKDQYRWLTYV